jgi:hypothetical protein
MTMHAVPSRAVSPAMELALAVLAAVCATVVTYFCKASGLVQIIGIVVGAAIPPLVTAIGPWRPLRASVAVLVSGAAVVLTYGGSLVVGEATGIPVVPSLPGQELPGSGSPQGTPGSSPVEDPKPGGIDVTPAVLRCEPECRSPITVVNHGQDELTVDIAVTGPDRGRFQHASDCGRHALGPGEECVVEIQFDGTGDGVRAAALEVADSGGGRRSVTLSGQASKPRFNLMASLATALCTVRPSESAVGRDVVKVSFTISMTTGNPRSPISVSVSLGSDTGAVTIFRKAIDRKVVPVAVEASIRPTDLGHSREFAVILDPENEIAEDQESDNELTVVVHVPRRPVALGRTVVSKCGAS